LDGLTKQQVEKRIKEGLVNNTPLSANTEKVSEQKNHEITQNVIKEVLPQKEAVNDEKIKDTTENDSKMDELFVDAMKDNNKTVIEDIVAKESEIKTDDVADEKEEKIVENTAMLNSEVNITTEASKNITDSVHVVDNSNRRSEEVTVKQEYIVNSTPDEVVVEIDDDDIGVADYLLEGEGQDEWELDPAKALGVSGEENQSEKIIIKVK